MRAVAVLLALVACAVLAQYVDEYPYESTRNADPIWKVFCDNLYGGRVDTIVNPGTYSAHVHRVFGGSNFGPGQKTRTPEAQFDVTMKSPCTTCSLKEIDNSNYWTADLYYRWPNNTYSLVPSGGLTVYYLSRDGPTGKNKTDPNWQPIPKGLRIVAGQPMRRTYDPKNMAHKAIDYVCLNYAGGGFDQSHDWSGLATHKCPQGLRTQVFFPMCWDGKNLDSPDHASHMAYPIQNPNGGDCPNSHPVRIPGVFFEHIFQVGKFPHGNGVNNFLWSMGDPTGYGHHGDFLSGWDENVMRQAIADPKCSNSNPNMANGNQVRACPPLRPYVKDGSEPKCLGINKPVALTENLGLSRPIRRIPGCYVSTGQLADCDKGPAGSDNDGTFFIYSNGTGLYLSAQLNGFVVTTTSRKNFDYSAVWAYGTAPGTDVTIQNAGAEQVMSAQTNAKLQGGASTWEYWTVIPQGGSQNVVAFKSLRNGKYLSATAGGRLSITAATVGVNETFVMVQNDGGYVSATDGYTGEAITTVDRPEFTDTDAYKPKEKPVAEVNGDPSLGNDAATVFGYGVVLVTLFALFL